MIDVVSNIWAISLLVEYSFPFPFSALGIHSDATEANIKFAFHSLARQYHPGNAEATEKMKEINLAYEILSTRSWVTLNSRSRTLN